MPNDILASLEGLSVKGTVVSSLESLAAGEPNVVVTKPELGPLWRLERAKVREALSAARGVCENSELRFDSLEESVNHQQVLRKIQGLLGLVQK